MMSNHSYNYCNIQDWAQPALASCHVLKWIGSYLCFVFLCGVVLNGIILTIHLENRKRRSPIEVFILALCFSNLAAAILGIPLPLTSNLACRWLYGKYLCYYEGFVAYFVGMVGLYLLTSLSLNRYWMIVTPHREYLLTFQTAYISVVLSVLGGLFWATTPMFGWNNYTLEGVLTSCSICWQARTVNVISYNVAMFIFAYVLPLFIMAYCNICIYLKVREVTRMKASRFVQRHISKRRWKRQTMERHIAKSVFLVILAFTVAWTPYAIAAFISSFFSPTLISPLGGTLPAIFAKSSICFNPLTYIISNSHIRSKVFSRRIPFRSSDVYSPVKLPYQLANAPLKSQIVVNNSSK
ncbi:unnamed protein product [Adineta ricciae]|uniref:G-protein coupled receptors family 1 profile domain-containing protein n=1 Tax=Adineta ricciae TaxID=249248 RepID=A0A813PJH8_ADIRI|nr:unnamed protein product [Adineta ricciae]